MNHIMKLAHNLLQYFCYNNPTNQAKLYELYFNDYHQISEVSVWPIEIDATNVFVQEQEVETCCYIFMNNVHLCKTITEKHVQHFVHLIELHGRRVLYIKFLQTIVKAENQYIKNCQDLVMAEVRRADRFDAIRRRSSLQLASSDEALMFYEKGNLPDLVERMQSEHERTDSGSLLNYHVQLVHLLAMCTEGKNASTEIKCHSLIGLDDIVLIVTHPDCIPEVRSTSSTDEGDRDHYCLGEKCLHHVSQSLLHRYGSGDERDLQQPTYLHADWKFVLSRYRKSSFEIVERIDRSAEFFSSWSPRRVNAEIWRNTFWTPWPIWSISSLVRPSSNNLQRHR